MLRLQQEGAIEVGMRSSGLCGGMTTARFVTTPEVYPDSPTTTPARCNEAQVTAARATIEYLERA